MLDYPLLVIVLLLIALMFLGSPVIFAIGFSALAYFFIEPGLTSMLDVYAHKFFSGMDVFIWLSIPLFIVAGEIMSSIGMTERLVNLSRLMVGRLRGGLAYVNVVGSMLFSGVSGSALADISALGPVQMKMMKQDGYEEDFSAALTVSSAIQGPIIPPSIPLIIFSALTNTSVAALFLAGAVPGLMLGLAQIGVVFILARRRGFKSNPIKGLNIKLALHIFYNSFFAIFMPLIIIGGIISGVFTATEAASIAVAYALVVGVFAYRSLSLKDLWGILDRSARTSASVYLIVGFATIISWVIANEQLPSQIMGLLESYHLEPWALLLILNVFFLINGLWVGDSVQLLLFAPLFTPILATMGVDPVHFGVVMVMNVMIGLMTPPYGLGLYLGSTISGVPLGRIIRASIPFLISNLIVLLVVTYVPAVSLTLPKIFGFM